MTDGKKMQMKAAAGFAALGPARAVLGESPVWSARDNRVWWVDIDGRRLLRTGLDGVSRDWVTPEAPGFVQLDSRDNPVLGMQTGLFRFDPLTAAFRRLAALNEPGVRFNDSCVDTLGRLWAGTMDMEGARACGQLYLIGPDRQLSPVLDGFRIINGLAWDGDRQRLFVSDSHPDVRTIWTLDCPGGRPDPASRRVFARLEGADGRPDGAVIDRAGRYWIAGVDGAVLHRFAADGTRMDSFAAPTDDPTKPAFAGEDMSQMVLTCKNGPLAIWNIGAELGVAGGPTPRWIDGRTDTDDRKEPEG